MLSALRCLSLVCFVWFAPPCAADQVNDYLEEYFLTFPSAATAAGRHDLDRQLESLGRKERQSWLHFNRRTAAEVESKLDDPQLGYQERLDLELLVQEARRQIFDFETLRIPERDPLYWTKILANATVFLLVRDDLPLAERLESANARAVLIPHLATEARAALKRSRPDELAPELCQMAASQARSSATFYRQGFFKVAAGADGDIESRLKASGREAAVALTDLAAFLSELAGEASGSFLLAEDYAEKFRLVTGIDEPVENILADAQQELARKVEETASYARQIWPEIFPDRVAPADDKTIIRTLFERVSQDRAGSTDEFVNDYRTLVDRSVSFVRAKDVMTLLEPLTLILDRSPSFFIGQSVGGVYPAGPYASPDAKTLLFLPTPSDDATTEQRDAFFRDFNHHFNVMITPHELIPGHYLQLKYAARQPHKVRALFGDGVYIEGWGTFAERLMLDLGWGGPLDRISHLKKQLENIARTIVDIRVHTLGMTRDEVLTFVQEQALQDEQFAVNMWRRVLTSSPQLTFYYLGYREVWDLYETVRSVRGSRFDLKQFMDGMMELGPVAVRHYRQAMLGE